MMTREQIKKIVRLTETIVSRKLNEAPMTVPGMNDSDFGVSNQRKIEDFLNVFNNQDFDDWYNNELQDWISGEIPQNKFSTKFAQSTMDIYRYLKSRLAKI